MFWWTRGAEIVRGPISCLYPVTCTQRGISRSAWFPSVPRRHRGEQQPREISFGSRTPPASSIEENTTGHLNETLRLLETGVLKGTRTCIKREQFYLLVLTCREGATFYITKSLFAKFYCDRLMPKLKWF